MKLAARIAVSVLPLLLSLPAIAAPPDHWVGTWAASPMALVNPEGKYGAADTTYREIVHTSLGGNASRVIFTNEFGLDTLTINSASIALRTKGSEIDTATARPLTFGGQTSIVIPPGALAISDPAALKLAPLSDVAVSFTVPTQPLRQVSQHSFADTTSYTAPGSVTSAKSFDTPTEITNWPFLKGIDVMASGDSASIVAFGDSITDGSHSTKDTNRRWPDILAQRLQADKKTRKLGVLNQGIGGNRILHDKTGPSALARFDRDVLAQAGVKYLIILESINDIGHAQDPKKPYDVVSADDLIQGFSQMAARAHTHGIKVYGATLTPYVGAGYASPAGEAMRQAVNKWIRTSSTLDGFVDFDKATQDMNNPAVLSVLADGGDHLHPSDAGYKSMGDSIDLKLFSK
ncbi:MAG: SGNH/GDSL hydrolase family protein [Acidobacteria bacterium]|nr:SGNH/GDSL hydrolase family protein [Acidobacteriota bacterium]